MIDDLFERARRLLSLAERAGAEEAEVFGSVAKSVDIDLRKDQVEMASERPRKADMLSRFIGSRLSNSDKR